MKNEIKIVDTELKVMEVLWETGGAYASDIAKKMLDENNWKKNTTYTLISRLIEKNAVERQEPKFFCKPLVTKSDVVQAETSSIIDKICGGSKKMFFAAFLNDEQLSPEDIQELKDIINKKSQ